MISVKKVVESAQVVSDFCKEQRACQNCIFRKHASDHWECQMDAFDLGDVLSNIAAKKKNNGYL